MFSDNRRKNTGYYGKAFILMVKRSLKAEEFEENPCKSKKILAKVREELRNFSNISCNTFSIYL